MGKTIRQKHSSYYAGRWRQFTKAVDSNAKIGTLSEILGGVREEIALYAREIYMTKRGESEAP